jgi:hypothetical protein
MAPGPIVPPSSTHLISTMYLLDFLSSCDDSGKLQPLARVNHTKK